MPYTIKPQKRKGKVPSFHQLSQPLNNILDRVTPLQARGNRNLKMTFEDQLNALIFFHLEEHQSGRHLLQVLNE